MPDSGKYSLIPSQINCEDNGSDSQHPERWGFRNRVDDHITSIELDERAGLRIRFGQRGEPQVSALGPRDRAYRVDPNVPGEKTWYILSGQMNNRVWYINNAVKVTFYLNRFTEGDVCATCTGWSLGETINV